MPATMRSSTLVQQWCRQRPVLDSDLAAASLFLLLRVLLLAMAMPTMAMATMAMATMVRLAGETTTPRVLPPVPPVPVED